MVRAFVQDVVECHTHIHLVSCSCYCIFCLDTFERKLCMFNEPCKGGVVDSVFVPPYTPTVAVVIFVTCYEGVSWTDSFSHVTNVLVDIILSLKVLIWAVRACARYLHSCWSGLFMDGWRKVRNAWRVVLLLLLLLWFQQTQNNDLIPKKANQSMATRWMSHL